MGRASIIVAFVLVASSILATVTILPVNVRAATLYVGGVGPGNYTKIQDAIFAASPGDTIFVYSGTYRETLYTTAMTSLSLIGESRDTTVIDAGGVGGAVYIGNPWTSFKGFTVMNATTIGIRLSMKGFLHDCLIADNIIRDAKISILLNATGATTISNNIMVDGGISIDSPYNNRPEHWNTHTIDSLNTVNGKPVYYWKNATGGMVPADAGQIILANVTGATVSGQNMIGAYTGISVGFSSQVTLTSNYLSSNKGQGIYFGFSSDSTLAGNNLTGDFEGVNMYLSSSNKIDHNNFINNTYQASDITANYWDDGYPSGGNYWSDYTGVDMFSGPNQDQPGSDGIGDTPRHVSGGGSDDRYPLMKPVGQTPLLPYPPRNLRATAGNGEVTLSWDVPVFDGGSRITNYEVHRGMTPGGESFLTEVGNVLTYVDGGLTNGQTYYYQVSAKNAVGGGPKSNEANATPSLPTAPGPPTGLLASAGDKQITLTWSPPADNGGSPITNYRVYRGTVSGGEIFLTEVANVLTHTDTSLLNGQTYYYRVSAKNAVGEGQQSNEASAIPATTPGPPVGLSAVAGNWQVTLTWSAPSDNGGLPITNYRVYRGTVPGGESFIVQLGNVLSYTDTGLANGQVYYYKVSAVNAVGEGSLSNEASATPSSGLSPPSEPRNLLATPGDGQVTLTWTAPASDGGTPITRYVVYRGTTSGGETFLAEIGNVLTYIDAGLVNGQTYFYEVSAKNAVGEGPRSNEASSTPTVGFVAPSAPQTLQASAGNAQVTLTWSPPSLDGGSPITNYRVYRGTASGGESLLVEIGSVLAYVDAGLTNGQTYFYEVSAVNLTGEGPKSNEASATPAAPPPANLPPMCNIISPIHGAVVAGSYLVGGIANDVDGTVERVEVKIDNGSWIVPSGTTSWAYLWDTTVMANGQHAISARSFDGVNYSAVASVTVTVNNAPPPQEVPPFQQAFWGLLIVVAIETALLFYLFWRQRKDKAQREEELQDTSREGH